MNAPTGSLGIAPDLSYEVERRPFYVTKDGKGKPITELYTLLWYTTTRR